MKTLALLHMLLLPLASFADDSQAQREPPQAQSPSTHSAHCRDGSDCETSSAIKP